MMFFCFCIHRFAYYHSFMLYCLSCNYCLAYYHLFMIMFALFVAGTRREAPDATPAAGAGSRSAQSLPMGPGNFRALDVCVSVVVVRVYLYG
jgi:hypothetical protein